MRGYSSFGCVGFSLWWHLLLQSMGSRRVDSVVVEHRLSCSRHVGSSGTRIEPGDTCIGIFLTTGPQGSPQRACPRKNS